MTTVKYKMFATIKDIDDLSAVIQSGLPNQKCGGFDLFFCDVPSRQVAKEMLMLFREIIKALNREPWNKVHFLKPTMRRTKTFTILTTLAKHPVAGCDHPTPRCYRLFGDEIAKQFGVEYEGYEIYVSGCSPEDLNAFMEQLRTQVQ